MYLITIFPVTVICAIFLFIAREILEFYKKKSVESRKKQAILKLISREIELNNWFVRSVRHLLDDIEIAVKSSPPMKFKLDFLKTGRVRLEITRADGKLYRGSDIPNTHKENIVKYILDVASLDKNLFEQMQEAYDAIEQLEHIRKGIISNLSGEIAVPGQDIDDFFDSYIGYARSEISKSFARLAILYSTSTGEELSEKKFRLR